MRLTLLVLALATACARGPYCDEVAAHLKALPGDDRVGLTTLAEQCKSWPREQRLCYLRAHDVAGAHACDGPPDAGAGNQKSQSVHSPSE